MRIANRWNSVEILGPHPISASSIDEKKKDELTDLFFIDAATEYDARHLHAKLQHKSLPKPVERYISVWRRDEDNHYRGLRRLLSCVTARSEFDIDEEMAARKPNFGQMQELLNDPFKLMVAFAYDERVTVQAYSMDYPLYDSLGPRLGEWVRRTNRDEALHYRNAVHVVGTYFQDRLNEVPSIVRSLLGHDLARSQYKATFLLDHDDGQLYFTRERLERCAEIVTRTLTRNVAVPP